MYIIVTKLVFSRNSPQGSVRTHVRCCGWF